jgi:hypothetical protein
MVPKWFLENWFQGGARSTLVLIGSSLVLFWGIFYLGASSISLVVDLPRFFQNEGSWLFAAKAFTAGDAGSAAATGFYPLHAIFFSLLQGNALQNLLILRAFTLIFMALISVFFFFEAKSKSFPLLGIILLSLLYLFWSQNSSNAWNPLVPAIFFFWLGTLFRRANLWSVSIVFLLLSALFDIRMVFLGFLYLLSICLYEKKKISPALIFLGSFFALNIFFLFFYGIAESLSLWKNHLEDISLKNASIMDSKILGAPLSVMGAWILSFFFWRSTINYRIAAILAVISYAALSVFREGFSFVFGSIYWLPVFVILGLIALLFSEKKSDPYHFEILLLSILLAACFFPLGSIANAIAIFPFYLFGAIYLLFSVSQRYPNVWKFWWYFPLVVFLLGGATQQVRSIFLRDSAKPNSWGLRSAGNIDRWLNDAAGLKLELENMGWNPAEEVEIQPENFALRAFWGYAYPLKGKPTYRIFIQEEKYKISRINEPKQ